jgi:hypothetical protein
MVFLLESWFCVCFFASSFFQVRICGKQPNLRVGQKQQELPRFMRFNGEQLTVPVVKASCDKGWHWISGTLTASLFKHKICQISCWWLWQEFDVLLHVKY